MFALNKKKEIVPASENLCKKEAFYCPTCRERVCLKVGQIKRSHFAHYRNQDCHAFSEGETEEHLQGKLQLATYLKMKEANVQLEAYLPELQQRPDLLFEKNGKKIAIEFQCSSISIENIMERTQGYLNANYEVIWILGKNFKYMNKLTAFHKACLYSSVGQEQAMLIHYDVSTDCLLVRYDFEVLRNGQMSCQLEQMNLNKKQSIKLTKQKKFKIDEKGCKDTERKHEQLMREVRYPSVKMQEFLKLIYLNQENIVSIPKEIYQCMPSEWMIQTHPMNWKYQFILWIEKFPRKKILTMKMLQLWINKQIEEKLIIYYRNPQIKNKVILRPFLEWIEFLEKGGMLKEISHLKWSYQRPLERYKNLEEKFAIEF